VRKHEPTAESRKTVQAMSGYGIPQDDIATVIGVSPHTLREHYRQELDTGQIIAISKVAQNLFRIATGEGREAVTAAIFWLKTRAQWSEYTAPQPPKAAPLGKKEQAAIDAETAAIGTDWGSLVSH
jgi:DNA-binding XRE family transcriptional regulator